MYYSDRVLKEQLRRHMHDCHLQYMELIRNYMEHMHIANLQEFSYLQAKYLYCKLHMQPGKIAFLYLLI